MPFATATTPARVALAGNPSDGYGGRTLAVCIDAFAARVTVATGVDAERQEDLGDAKQLVDATVDRFARLTGRDAPCSVAVTTTIPREVGLAGSSAIVVATLRALAAVHDVELEPDRLAHEALAVEVEDLGIAAGPQDRIVQARGGLVAMDFATGRHRNLDPGLLPPLFVAWRPDGEPSGRVHGDLRARWEAGDPAVRHAMRRLANLALTAEEALLAGDHDTFGRCLDESFDQRASILELDPRDVALIDAARATAAHANYAGSGGAVVGTLPAAGDMRGLVRAYEEVGARVRPIEPASLQQQSVHF